MRPYEVELQLLQILLFDDFVGEVTETGIDSIDYSCSLLNHSLYDCPALPYSLPALGSKVYLGFSSHGQLHELLGRQSLPVQIVTLHMKAVIFIFMRFEEFRINRSAPLRGSVVPTAAPALAELQPHRLPCQDATFACETDLRNWLQPECGKGASFLQFGWRV